MLENINHFDQLRDHACIGQFITELRFDVSDIAPTGHMVSFSLVLEDENTNQWTLNFEIEVH